MNTIADDLAQITAGESVMRFANDDDRFAEAVAELQYLGHSHEAAEAALGEWIDNTPTWNCPECGLENIEEAGWANCPNCDADNPSVVTLSFRAFNGNTGDTGGIDATTGGVTVKFNSLPGDSLACQSCGATVTDWRYTTVNGEKTTAPKVNLMLHAAFHARLGF